MANVSTANLTDKEIRSLKPQNSKFIKAIGNPKELYIRVYPSGKKTFCLLYNGKMIKIKEFREGIFSVAEARKEAIRLLNGLENGKSLEIIQGKGKDFLFKTLGDRYLEILKNKGTNDRYLRQISQRIEAHLYPKLAKKDIKEIKSGELFEILQVLYTPNLAKNRLEMIYRLISYLNNIFLLAIEDGYIENNPAINLKNKFLTPQKFNEKNGIDNRRKALIKDSDIAEFIRDLKFDNRLEISTKNALWLQILSGNRPYNTISLKWSYIDFKNKIWTIPAVEMKNKKQHLIALSSQMIKILKAQQEIARNSEYVFKSLTNPKKHLSENTLSKAVREILANGKWRDKVVPYGFRSTFKTICTLNLTTLYGLNISEKVVEEAMDHSTKGMAKHYERAKATIKQKADLMQWYADYLENLERIFDE